MKKTEGINFFEKYLSIWVALCMVVGVIIGRYFGFIPEFLGRFEYANVSIPIAILIWVMIYPMMMKVDFASVKNVGKSPKGLFVTVHDGRVVQKRAIAFLDFRHPPASRSWSARLMRP